MAKQKLKDEIRKIILILEEDKREASKFIEDHGTTLDEIMNQDNDPNYEAGVINQADYVISLLEKLLTNNK